MTAIPQKGDRVEVEVLTGYRLHQERPFACRPACTCGSCYGTTTVYPGTVTNMLYYADNSIESEVLCDDGQTRTMRHKPPSGDVCY
jgi:hypothetical protein